MGVYMIFLRVAHVIIIFSFMSADIIVVVESLICCAFMFFREIDRDEFKKVMALMRSQNRQGASHCDGLRAGIKIGGLVENGGLVEYFFGKDGELSLIHI